MCKPPPCTQGREHPRLATEEHIPRKKAHCRIRTLGNHPNFEKKKRSEWKGHSRSNSRNSGPISEQLSEMRHGKPICGAILEPTPGVGGKPKFQPKFLERFLQWTSFEWSAKPKITKLSVTVRPGTIVSEIYLYIYVCQEALTVGATRFVEINSAKGGGSSQLQSAIWFLSQYGRKPHVKLSLSLYSWETLSLSLSLSLFCCWSEPSRSSWKLFVVLVCTCTLLKETSYAGETKVDILKALDSCLHEE